MAFNNALISKTTKRSNPAGIYVFKVKNRNTRKSNEIYSKLTIRTSQRRHLSRSNVFVVNFERISHLVLVFYC